MWSVAGSGFYGTPFSEVTRKGFPIIGALFVLGGPLGLLPLALLSRPGRVLPALRSPQDGKQLREIGVVKFVPTALAFSPDGTRVAIGGAGAILQGYVRGVIRVFALESNR